MLLALTLSMSCSLLAGCQTERIASAVRPDLDHPDRLVCETAGERPPLPSAYVIDWPHVTTVEQAKAEHEIYVRSVLARNGVLAAYIVEIEGKLFTCSNNAQFWRDYWSGLPTE